MYSRFEHLCDLKGVTPYRVGKETGVNSATFTEWKKGGYTPKRQTLKKIADYFNVPVTYFYEGSEDDADNYLLDVAVTHLSSSLREDQRRIIKRAASLTPDEVIVVDSVIEAMQGQPTLGPGSLSAILMFIKALRGLYNEGDEWPPKPTQA